MITKAIGVLLILATIATGIWVDIAWLLVGGITEIIHGAEAHPVSGGQIGWGLAHIVFTGVGLFVALGLCVLWSVLFFGRAPRHRVSRSPHAGGGSW